MDDNQIVGAAREGFGHAQDAWGGATGDLKSQARGKLNEARGGAQKLYGDARDQFGKSIDDAVGEVRMMIEEQVERVIRNPMMALGVALGVGVALGLMTQIGSRPRVVYVKR